MTSLSLMFRNFEPSTSEPLHCQHDYEVLTAIDSENAIEAFYAHKLQVDIVFLDLGLPKISGENVFFLK